jgi:2-polyprenyl-3-methyl-5-hydroxy-6-metoxy-1,4-benzoquinol methylase
MIQYRKFPNNSSPVKEKRRFFVLTCNSGIIKLSFKEETKMCLSHETNLAFNYLYVLNYAEQQCHGKASCAILDYGCGRGETILTGQKWGLNIYGAEVLYKAETLKKVEESGLLGGKIREIKDGVMDFPEATFDFVFSNQVIEHVEDLDQVIKEIWRVLKPGCSTLHLFPSRDVWREGHCGIPFLHWFSRNSRLRYQYAIFLRTIGLGTFTNERVDHPAWTRMVLNYLDNHCFYRTRKEIFTTFGKYFDLTLIEDNYVHARLGKTRLRALAPLTEWPLIRSLAREAFRKLGGLVLLATKRADS